MSFVALREVVAGIIAGEVVHVLDAVAVVRECVPLGNPVETINNEVLPAAHGALSVLTMHHTLANRVGTLYKVCMPLLRHTGMARQEFCGGITAEHDRQCVRACLALLGRVLGRDLRWIRKTLAVLRHGDTLTRNTPWLRLSSSNVTMVLVAKAKKPPPKPVPETYDRTMETHLPGLGMAAVTYLVAGASRTWTCWETSACGTPPPGSRQPSHPRTPWRYRCTTPARRPKALKGRISTA
eukprot:gene19728-26420_t